MSDDDKGRAERWTLARDENMEHLMVWQRVKKRAEAGGFNGILASDYAKAREAMAVLSGTESEPLRRAQ